LRELKGVRQVGQNLFVLDLMTRLTHVAQNTCPHSVDIRDSPLEIISDSISKQTGHVASSRHLRLLGGLRLRDRSQVLLVET